MDIVFLTALGVGGATVAGAAIGFFFKNSSARFADRILAFSSGVMLAAAVFGLILPALESGERHGLIVALAGIFCGAVCMDHLERIVTALRPCQTEQNHVMLFVAAIAIHNLPEGIAAGVGFGTGSISDALMIAGGIALQNIPEGMVIIGPMLSIGKTPKQTFLIALITGLIEVAGTFLGYFAISLSCAILPFALTFAGGTMLFIICGEMIPRSCCHDPGNWEAYALLAGFCTMLALSVLL